MSDTASIEHVRRREARPKARERIVDWLFTIAFLALVLSLYGAIGYGLYILLF